MVSMLLIQQTDDVETDIRSGFCSVPYSDALIYMSVYSGISLYYHQLLLKLVINISPFRPLHNTALKHFMVRFATVHVFDNGKLN